MMLRAPCVLMLTSPISTVWRTSFSLTGAARLIVVGGDLHLLVALHVEIAQRMRLRGTSGSTNACACVMSPQRIVAA